MRAIVQATIVVDRKLFVRSPRERKRGLEGEKEQGREREILGEGERGGRKVASLENGRRKWQNGTRGERNGKGERRR